MKTIHSDYKRKVRSTDGYLPLEGYGVLGDGRTIAMTGDDGSIDWWCVPNMDSPPLFDRLLDAPDGGYFTIIPNEEFSVTRGYLKGSNVLETIFTTASGEAALIESLNSGMAGRLPWAELARRVEGRKGHVSFKIEIRYSRQAGTVNPYFAKAGHHQVFHADRVLGIFLHSDGVKVEKLDDAGVSATVNIKSGYRETLAIIAEQDEPLVVPSIAEIDQRIDASDFEWRQWSDKISFEGRYRDLLIRNALVLKLLLYSPTGAITAAGTTSLPERIGGSKNYDYRFAWIRDAGYTIKAFLRIGAQAEAKAAFSWLLKRLKNEGPEVCYTLQGAKVSDITEIDLPGYRNSKPVVRGNRATHQHQHGIYGDIFETAARFVFSGCLLDSQSAETLSRLADQCADRWRMPDSGIWELPELKHYTMSKISCWQALARASELADGGYLPTTCRDRWVRERDRIEEWINQNCWSEELKAYEFYPGSGKLDASLALAVRFEFDGKERLALTLDAIDRELSSGPYHYRYSGVLTEEECFLACSFWMVEARALLGEKKRANEQFESLVAALNIGVGVYTEMADPKTGAYLGNMPQGLTHLALIQAVATLAGVKI